MVKTRKLQGIVLKDLDDAYIHGAEAGWYIYNTGNDVTVHNSFYGALIPKNCFFLDPQKLKISGNLERLVGKSPISYAVTNTQELYEDKSGHKTRTLRRFSGGEKDIWVDNKHLDIFDLDLCVFNTNKAFNALFVHNAAGVIIGFVAAVKEVEK